MNRLSQIFLTAMLFILFMPAPASAQRQQDIEADFDQDVDLSGCVMPGFKMPPEAKIYALGAQTNSKLGWLIDDSGREAALMKVAVNSPGEPVILILSASEPTIWHLGRTRGSRIAAVVISGQYAQKITGLPKDVPVLTSTKESGWPCGEFYIQSNRRTIPPKANTISKRLFGREIDNMFGVISGQAVVGQMLPAEAELITNGELRREDFHPADKPLFGEAGIKEAIDKGLIKKAVSSDIQEYYRLLARAKGLPQQITPKSFTDNLGLDGAYVVLSPAFVVPPGLPHWSKFLVLSESAEPLEKKDPAIFFSAAKAASQKKETPSFECGFSGLNLPPDFQIFAAGGYDSGLPLDLPLGFRNNDTKLIKVTVNSPDKPAVLMLGNYSPTVWHFSWTKGSRIAAVAVSGNYPPIVSGLPDDVPILKINNDYLIDSDLYKKCPRINVQPIIDYLTAANDFARHLFEKDIDQIGKIENGTVLFGQPVNDQARLETGQEFSLEKFNDPHKPLTYKVSFDEAKRKGLIRISEHADIQAYLKALGQKLGLPDRVIDDGLSLSHEAPADHSLFGDFSLLYSYTILSPEYLIPEDLYPPDVRISFILPQGMKKPARAPDNVIIYDVNDPKLPEKKGSQTEAPKPCTLPKVELPPETQIYAGSGFLSSPVDFDFGEKSGRRDRAELTPLKINSPAAPVALILQGHGYYPTLWHFSWTEDTKIAAVVTAGRVIGLPPEVPVINPNDCPKRLFFPTAISNFNDIAALMGINDLSKNIFNQNIDRLYYQENNGSLIGEPLPEEAGLITARELKLNELIDPDKPWGDQPALTEDILKGFIRKATTQDMRELLKNSAREAGLPEHIINSLNLYDRTRPTHYMFNENEPNPIPNTYMVLSPDFNIPATLYHSQFEPMGRTSHGSYDSESGTFYYPDGSVIWCSFTPDKSKTPARNSSAAKALKSASSSNKSNQIGLPPNFRLIYKSHPLDEAYEVLTPDTIYPAHEGGGNLSAAFTLPDGSFTHCSYSNNPDRWVPFGLRQQQLPKACAIPHFQAPPELKVFAAGVRSGTKLNITMGDGGRTAELVKVTLNSPEEPAALLLKASEPTIWHLSWTGGTKIAAVVVSGGFNPQRLVGLPKGAPVLHTGEGCPSFDVSLSNIYAAINVNNLAKHLFHKDIDKIYDIYGGQIVIGETPLGDRKVETAEEFDIDKFTDPNIPLAGIHGLNQALSKGLIRKATDEDYKMWLTRHYTKMQNIPEDKVEEAIADDRREYKYNRPPNPYNDAYVVLSPDFIVPAGLNSYGSDSADFIIPEDIPMPSRRHSDNSTFYLLKDGSCEGKEAVPVCQGKR